jgi:hypothetical protein
MFGIEWLDIGLGVIFIYLLVSLACTAVTDAISAFLGMRWRNLKKGISNLLHDKDALQRLYDFPLIRSLFEGNKPPSYISAQVFSASIFDQAFGVTRPDAISQANDLIAKSNIGDALKKSLTAIIGVTEGKLETFRAKVEQWYDGAMENVSALYKRKAQVISLAVALVLAGAANIDTISIAQFFSRNAVVRTAVASHVFQTVASETPAPAPISPTEQFKEMTSTLSEYGIPFGWSKASEPSPGGIVEKPGTIPANAGFGFWLLKIVGIILTALAASLGAPFWFDILKKIAGARKTTEQAPKGEQKTP